MKKLILLLLLAACTKHDIHNRIIGQFQTCIGAYHYNAQCFPGKIQVVVKATYGTMPATLTIYYTGGSKTITTAFRPPQQLAIFAITFDIPPGAHLLRVEAKECSL